MPLPAVAVRYSAMRGESLEPGGCSAWPISAWANCSARCPAVVAVAVAVVGAAPATPVAPADDVAPCRADAKAVEVAVVGAAVVGGTRPWCSSAILASTFSTLIPHRGRHGGRGLQRRPSAP